MSTEELIDAVEQDDRTHRARLLILLHAFSEKSDAALDLVRVAYLDYFLRYPAALEAVLQSRGNQGSRLRIEPYERESIESTIGALYVKPWDVEYRRWIAAEFAAGRVEARILHHGKFSVALTEAGQKAATSLSESEPFKILLQRALTIASNLNLQSSTLRSAISRALPATRALEVGAA